MISERKFANSYSSFWSELLPTADYFVRQLNLAAKRFDFPVGSIVSADRDRRAVINELAFRLFKVKASGSELLTETILDVEVAVRSFIGRLAHAQIDIDPLDDDELKETHSLLSSLETYFSGVDLNTLLFWPRFLGCGQVDTCRGDIISNRKLVEVKAGDRRFRVIDIRQLITYLSLNFISREHEISEVGLVNPRTGLHFECSVDLLIGASSGRKSVDVFSDVVEFVSSEIGSI